MTPCPPPDVPCILYKGQTIGFKAIVTDDEDGLPLCPVPTTVSVEVRTDDEATQILAPTTLTLQVVDNGQATAGGAKTLTDTAQAWLENQHAGACLIITAGTGVGQERRIKSNTATILTIDDKHVVNNALQGAFNPQPDATSVYQIHRGIYRKNWDAPTNPTDGDLVAIFRAATTGGNPWKSPAKLPFRLVGPTV